VLGRRWGVLNGARRGRWLLAGGCVPQKRSRRVITGRWAHGDSRWAWLVQKRIVKFKEEPLCHDEIKDRKAEKGTIVRKRD